MTYLLSLVMGIVGTALGFALGAAAAAALASLLGITSFEGASGYFAVFVGGPLGGLGGLLLGAWLVLRRAGLRGGAVAARLGLVFVGMIVLAATGLGMFWLMRPSVNANGPAPRLVFEIRLPSGVEASRPSDVVELQTGKNTMPALLSGVRRDGGSEVLSGSVELYYRTWNRMLVLRLPDKTDVLFELSLGLTPTHTRTFTDWRRANYIARPGDQQARRTTSADAWEVRYRVDWSGED